MIAMLRYAFLKSLRDGSLAAFVVAPIVCGVVSFVAISIDRSGGYANWSAVQRAELATTIAGIVAIVFASMSAFWTLRGEISTRSIGAFLFAARPLSVVADLMVFGTTIGFVGALLATGTLAAFAAAFPRFLLLLVFKTLLGCLAGAAVGALAVMISPQPIMLVIAYLGCLFIILSLSLPKSSESPPALVLVALAVLCAGVSAFLLERRCAT